MTERRSARKFDETKRWLRFASLISAMKGMNRDAQKDFLHEALSESKYLHQFIVLALDPFTQFYFDPEECEYARPEPGPKSFLQLLKEAQGQTGGQLSAARWAWLLERTVQPVIDAVTQVLTKYIDWKLTIADVNEVFDELQLPLIRPVNVPSMRIGLKHKAVTDKLALTHNDGSIILACWISKTSDPTFIADAGNAVYLGYAQEELQYVSDYHECVLLGFMRDVFYGDRNETLFSVFDCLAHNEYQTNKSKLTLLERQSRVSNVLKCVEQDRVIRQPIVPHTVDDRRRMIRKAKAKNQNHLLYIPNNTTVRSRIHVKCL